MTLRAKILFLLFGIIFIPFLSMAVLVVVNINVRDNSSSFRTIRHTIRYIELSQKESIDKQELRQMIQETPELNVFALGEDGSVLFSTKPQLNHSNEILSSVLSEAGKQGVNLKILPVRYSDGEKGRIVILMPPLGIINTAPKLSRLLPPLVMILFITFMAVFILRSINRSISNLEKAAGRIADGDLGFELKPKGNDQFAKLIRSFDEMRKSLREEYDRRSRFMMGISHDLKSPLASIEGYVDAVRDGYADTREKFNEYLDIISGKTKLLETRISALIEYVTHMSREWDMKTRRVTLERFLTEYCDIFESEARIRGFSFEHEVDLSPDISAVLDEDLLLRAFDNLSHNTFRFTEEGGYIGFFASEQDGTVIVKFINAGRNIPREDIHNIFEPFYRGSMSRSSAGSGLGLSIVKSIILAHHWEVTAEVSGDDRMEVIIRIPLNGRGLVR